MYSFKPTFYSNLAKCVDSMIMPSFATRFPALFSHSARQHASVASVVTQGLDLQARLTTVAGAELATVRRIIDCTHLGVGHDGQAIDSPLAPRFCS
jgi:hypothetical protein